MPFPQKGESKSDFISRAIKEFMGKEGRSQVQAIGRAEGFWSEYGTKKKKKGTKI